MPTLTAPLGPLTLILRPAEWGSDAALWWGGRKLWRCVVGLA